MTRIRLVTYNIKVGVETDTDTVARAVARLSPDLVALQEVGRHWVMGDGQDQTESIARMAGLPHRVFSPALTAQPGEGAEVDAGKGEGGPGDLVPGFGISLLSKWPISRVHTVKLPVITDEQRILVWGQVELPGVGPVTVANTHLSCLGPDRVEQVRRVKAELSGVPSPVFLLGDLNDVPGSPVIGELESFLNNLHKSHYRGEQLSTYPTPAATGLAARDHARWIDYVMISPGMVWEKVHMWVAEDVLASDHWPVVVDLYG